MEREKGARLVSVKSHFVLDLVVATVIYLHDTCGTTQASRRSQ